MSEETRRGWFRWVARGAVLAALLGAATVLLVLLPSKEHGSITGDDIGIRLAGVRPNEGDAIHDARGRKLPDRPLFLADNGYWEDTDLRRDFIFELPDEIENSFLRAEMQIRPVNGTRPRTTPHNYTLRTTSGLKLVLSGRLPKYYVWNPLSSIEIPRQLKSVDVTLKYYAGPISDAVCLFEGPFSEQKTSIATGRADCTLTAIPKSEARRPGREFTLSLPGVDATGMRVLVYGLDGTRREPSLLDKKMTPEQSTLHCLSLNMPLGEIANITVGERPMETTFHGIRVRFRGVKERTRAEYLDTMAERLEITQLSDEDLARYPLQEPVQMAKTVDVLRGRHAMQLQRSFPSHEWARHLASLDNESRERFRMTMRKWAESDNLHIRESGVTIGLAGGWHEFVGYALDLISTGKGTQREMAAQLLETHAPLIEDEYIVRIGEELKKAETRDVASHLMACLGKTKTPAATEMLIELARDERPWLWLGAIEKVDGRVEVEDRKKWDRELRKKAIIAFNNDPAPEPDEELRREAWAELASLLTPETAYMNMEAFTHRLLRRVADHIDAEAATEAISSFLVAVEDPEEVQISLKSAVALLNQIHGKSIGGVGADIISIGPGFEDPEQLLADALVWLETGIDPCAIADDYRVTAKDMRVVWLKSDDLEKSLIGISPHPANPVTSARCYRLESGLSYLMYRIRPSSDSDNDWRVSLETHVSGESRRRSLFSMGTEIPDADIPLKVWPKDESSSNDRTGGWEVHIERADSPESVLSGTKVFEEWWEEYGPKGDE